MNKDNNCQDCIYYSKVRTKCNYYGHNVNPEDYCNEWAKKPLLAREKWEYGILKDV